MLNYEKTYWNNRGKYQEEKESLDLFVPFTGRAKSNHIEVYRCLCNIYHDIYNNGGGNFGVRGSELDVLNVFNNYYRNVTLGWLDSSLYKCDSDPFWDWDDDEEDCPHYSFELTQKIVDELELLADDIIAWAYEQENFSNVD